MSQSHESLQRLVDGLPPKADSGYFGLEFETAEAALVIIPVSWDVTTSYSDGTHGAPEAVRKASHQLDLEDPQFGKTFMSGISQHRISLDVPGHNSRLRPVAESVIESWEAGDNALVTCASKLKEINDASEELTLVLREESKKLLKEGKLIGVLGGDHSCPLGLIQAIDRQGEAFSVLHIDAHHDLRDSYEGFKESHASIMYNVLKTCPNMERLVSVGIRDFSGDEKKLAEEDPRINTLYGHDMSKRRYEGESFMSVAEDILSRLGSRVYISFDIDGLDPAYCPNTGTPVPGGLHFQEWSYLAKRLVESGRKIVGFDLCEVGGQNEWDANVGARVLYNLCGVAITSQRSNTVGR